MAAEKEIKLHWVTNHGINNSTWLHKLSNVKEQLLQMHSKCCLSKQHWTKANLVKYCHSCPWSYDLHDSQERDVYDVSSAQL